METIEHVISVLSGWIWGPPLIILLVGTGLYLTIILKGMQFRALPYALSLIFKKEDQHETELYFSEIKIQDKK